MGAECKNVVCSVHQKFSSLIFIDIDGFSLFTRLYQYLETITG